MAKNNENSFKQEDLDKIVEAIKEAAKVVLSKWPGNPDSSELMVETKADGSLVTEADYASNNIIIKAINSIFPDHAILSEELPPPSNLKEAQNLWLIDPIDGTRSFVDGRDDFSILVALWSNDELEFSVMYFPARKELSKARRGQGAYLNGKPLSVSTSQKFAPNSIHLRHFDVEDNKYVLEQSLDSGFALHKLCQGELSGIITKLLSHREWDIAAPALIIEESGGKITDENGNRFKFNLGKMDAEFVVASNGILHEELLKYLP
jgi:myo-inositol-1(or 4)-monophosphatase